MKSKVLLIVGIAINALIWVNSLLPGYLSSSQSGLIVNLIYPIFENFISLNTFSVIIRKLAHFTQFMILAIVFVNYYKSINKNKFYLITLIHGLMVAIIDESIQLFVPGRSGLITDVLIDFSGVITGLLIVYIITIIKLKHINNN